ncbi:MAG: ATP synthase F0 subunit A [Chloroflexi bacterium]|nr:MAG: ATP synthase F0 subunit A [Chloroflexota bacterium]
MKILIAVGVIALVAVGVIFVKNPSPVVIVKPEHIFDLGPLAVTNTMFTSWCVVAILVVTGFFVGRNVSVVPSGFSGAIEALISGFYGIVTQVAGEENGRKFFWVIGTIFLYVLTSNYFGLLPMNGVIGKIEPGHGTPKQVIFEQTKIAGYPVAYIPNAPAACAGGDACPTKHVAGEHAEPKAAADGKFSGLISPWFRSVNTDVNTPLAIAIFSFIFVEYWGLSALGPGYLKKFFAVDFYKRGPLGLIDIFVGLLELVSELSRMVSFTFRLFGNVFAGEVLLAMMAFLVPFVLVDVFYGLELFVGLIQAFVFAMLTLVFAQTAVSHHGGEEHGSEHGEAHH